MKLPIKKKYFDMIKAGKKIHEFRDAHITFVCEETKEELRKEVEQVNMIVKEEVPEEFQEVIRDYYVMEFWLK